MSEIFPTRMRYLGSSFTYQIATIFAGSIAPLVATVLLNKFDSVLPIVLYVVAVLVLSTVSLSMLKETRGQNLADLDKPTPAH